MLGGIVNLLHGAFNSGAENRRAINPPLDSQRQQVPHDKQPALKRKTNIQQSTGVNLHFNSYTLCNGPHRGSNPANVNQQRENQCQSFHNQAPARSFNQRVKPSVNEHNGSNSNEHKSYWKGERQQNTNWKQNNSGAKQQGRTNTTQQTGAVSHPPRRWGYRGGEKNFNGKNDNREKTVIIKKTIIIKKK